MIEPVRRMLMYPNRDWNRAGPRISRGFRSRLKRVDPSLELQFLPPCAPGKMGGGIDRRFFPDGCWVVARKMRRSGMLIKSWVMHLGKPNQPFTQPGITELRLIKKARNLWRQNRGGHMEKLLDQAIEKMNNDVTASGRARMAKMIVDTCRRNCITNNSIGRTRVSMHGS